jgi:hypothetical protein
MHKALLDQSLEEAWRRTWNSFTNLANVSSGDWVRRCLWKRALQQTENYRNWQNKTRPAKDKSPSPLTPEPEMMLTAPGSNGQGNTPSNSQSSGQSNGQPSGQSNGQPSGQSNGQPSGQSNGQPNGQSDGQPKNQAQIIHKSSDYANSFCRRKGWNPKQLSDQQWTILQANYVAYKAQIQEHGQRVEDDFGIE